jgi:hypothetical protein
MQATIEAMTLTGDVPECAVMVDGQEYDIEWPKHWHVHNSYGHLEMQRALNALYQLYPSEKHYGLLSDQSRPVTPEWSKTLESVAGERYISMCNTTKNRINPRTNRRRMTTMCLPGDLVREVGWVWLDKVVHLWGDDAWEDIGYCLNIVKYVPNVVILALLKRDGEVELDSNHYRKWRGQSYMATDAAAFAKWQAEELPGLLKRLERFAC